MRLISTNPERMVLKEFIGSDVPPYAILSHCWGAVEDEVTFQQFQTGQNHNSSGYRKITQCCKIAKSQGLEWAWVDTCCIDKTSSAELSESINSMYAWYARSAICYAFLEDIEPDAQWSNQHIDWSQRSAGRKLPETRWFQRGWTLQELLAPGEVYFYDSKLTLLGTRLDFARQIDSITGIDEQFLNGTEAIHEACVAQRMSWASSRKTTRGEDIAYCLLGIFNINMPLLYGEGARGAFRRLQEAIIGQSDDDSIFAWQTAVPEERGLLSHSPSEFAGSRHVRHLRKEDSVAPFQVTNIGIGLRVHFLRPVLIDTLLVAAYKVFRSLSRPHEPSLFLLEHLSSIFSCQEMTLNLTCGEFESPTTGRRITLRLKTSTPFLSDVPLRWHRTETHSLCSGIARPVASIKREPTTWAVSQSPIYVSTIENMPVKVRWSEGIYADWDGIFFQFGIIFGCDYIASKGPEIAIHAVMVILLFIHVYDVQMIFSWLLGISITWAFNKGF